MAFADESFDVVLCQRGVQFFPTGMLACARWGASWPATAG
jgi:hypothetical protein